jgi:hypothetical protein
MNEERDMTISYIHTHVAGIPCRAEVTEYVNIEPQGPTADSDWDCYGEFRVDFRICDRRGRYAEWLERKMTDRDVRRITNEIDEAFREEAEEYFDIPYDFD